MRRSSYVNYYVLCLVCWILLGITGKLRGFSICQSRGENIHYSAKQMAVKILVAAGYGSRRGRCLWGRREGEDAAVFLSHVRVGLRSSRRCCRTDLRGGGAPWHSCRGWIDQILGCSDTLHTSVPLSLALLLSYATCIVRMRTRRSCAPRFSR